MDWIILTATLPTRPSALRLRVWRALKATGSGTLREGVYLLPAAAPSAPALRALAAQISAAGAGAHLLELDARDAAQDSDFQQLFDRSGLHAELQQSIKAAHRSLSQTSPAAAGKQLRSLDQQAQALSEIDFFPTAASAKTTAALAALRRAVALRLAPDEPQPSAQPITPRRIEDHQGRTWATRGRPWVDRLASAWLITRFIDRSPRFVWIATPSRCPKGALGYDFDGATFTHVGERVTFEVLAESFGLATDPALQRLAALVHCIDVGGAPVDEAPGTELAVRGLQALHPDDDALLAAALPFFDSLHAACRPTP